MKYTAVAWLLLLLMGCGPGEQSMTVTATAFNSVRGQTDGQPNVAAWGDILDPSIPTIAVSRDLLKLGLTHNTEVRIDGYDEVFLVRDKLNKRFTERIDIYMGKDVAAAREFGKQQLTIRWYADEGE